MSAGIAAGVLASHRVGPWRVRFDAAEVATLDHLRPSIRGEQISRAEVVRLAVVGMGALVRSRLDGELLAWLAIGSHARGDGPDLLRAIEVGEREPRTEVEIRITTMSATDRAALAHFELWVNASRPPGVARFGLAPVIRLAVQRWAEHEDTRRGSGLVCMPVSTWQATG